jgi:peroxiredoxin Q/BCP
MRGFAVWRKSQMVTENDKAPDFKLTADNGTDFQLSDQSGKRLLLVFYPGDNTPVCTRQLCEYRDGIEEFSNLGVSVIGISSNSLDSHQKFRSKHDLPFVLLSDTEFKVARLYGCKGALGMKRAIFLVDEQGLVRYAHIEKLSLFRRRAAELLKVIEDLDAGEQA